MDAVECEGYKKGNKVEHKADDQKQGKRWQMLVTDVKLTEFSAFLQGRAGVSSRRYQFLVKKLPSKGGSYSSGMRKACDQVDMKPVCDHPSYCANDLNSVYLGHTNHLSVRPHRRNNSWMPGGFMSISDKFNNLCVYTNNANGNYALCNIPINGHSWRHPGQTNPGFMCAKAVLPPAFEVGAPLALLSLRPTCSLLGTRAGVSRKV